MTFDYAIEQQNSRQKIAEAADMKQLEAVRIEYLGRKGKITAMYANLSSLSKEIGRASCRERV